MSFIFLRQHSFTQACNLMPKSLPGRVSKTYPINFQCSKSTLPKSKGKNPSQQSETRKPAAKHPSKQSEIKSPANKPILPLKPYRQPESKIKPPTKDDPTNKTPKGRDHDRKQFVEQFVSARQWKQEQDVQKNIKRRRKNLVWPGLFTVVTISGVYCGFAYLDERFDLQDWNLPAAEWSKSWYFTPTIIWEGIKNGWKELDKMTTGVIALYVGIYLTKRMPIKFYEKLAHIAGDRTWTLATYSFLQPTVGGLVTSIAFLVWFMPGVVRYFDGDYLHASAFYVSVPILLGFLTHFQFLGKNGTRGIPLEVGSSGALSALIGAFAMANPWEKVWVIVTGPFRIDAIYMAGGFVVREFWHMYKARGSGLHPTIAHSVSA